MHSQESDMTDSDWSDWLPRAVADADPDTVALWYLGCNGFAIKGSEGTVLWIDPYVGTGDPPRTVRMIPVPFDPDDIDEADAVLATHEHTDHVHGPSQAPILANTDADFVAPDDSLAVAREEERWTEEWEVDEEAFLEVTEGDELKIGEFTVHVVETEDADATHPVGYVIEHDSGTLFHAGDSKPSASFPGAGRRVRHRPRNLSVRVRRQGPGQGDGRTGRNEVVQRRKRDRGGRRGPRARPTHPDSLGHVEGADRGPDRAPRARSEPLAPEPTGDSRDRRPDRSVEFRPQ